MDSKFGTQAIYHYQLFDKDGNLKGESQGENIWTTEGMTYMVQAGLKTGSADTTWYLGLKPTASASVGAVLSAIGYAELRHYEATDRPVAVFGAVSAGSMDNSASVAVYTASATAEVSGAFLCNTASASAGRLVSHGDFSAVASMSPSDVLQVTVTVSAGQKV